MGGGELLVVVGSVGAGKSSLLSAVLGEMQLQQVFKHTGYGCGQNVRSRLGSTKGDAKRCDLVSAVVRHAIWLVVSIGCQACAFRTGGLAGVQGDLKVRGRCSYTAQDAWIQNASLRDNVLMGQPWDRTRYRAVVAACALQPDIDLLAAGAMR